MCENTKLQTIKPSELYRALFIIGRCGSSTEWQTAIKIVLERKDFNPLGNNGSLVCMVLEPTAPQHIKDSLQELFKTDSMIEWNLAMCVVLRALRNHDLLQNYVSRIRGCPVDLDTLYKIAKGEPVDCNMDSVALIAKYVG